MPNYFAHLQFGEQVLPLLASEMQQHVLHARPAFDLGCLGPDVLYFYRATLPNQVCRQGHHAHAQSALPLFLRLQAAFTQGVPMTAGYAAGLLCHLALDSACHGWLDQRQAEGGPSHLSMEAEYDRLWMLRQGASIHTAHLPPQPPSAALLAGAAAYQTVTAEQMGESYRSMQRYTALLSAWVDSRVGGALARIFDAVGPLKKVSGIFLPADAPHHYDESNRILDDFFFGAIPVAARQATHLLSALTQGDELPQWLDRDFKGNTADVHPTALLSSHV